MRSNSLMALWRRMHPADCAILAILALAAGVAGLAGNGRELHELLLIHVTMGLGYGLFALALVKWERIEWTGYLRPFVAMGTIWSLYYTLGWLGMAAMPFRADGFLSRVDTWIFAGTNPTFFVQRWQTPGRVEFFAFFYGLFIPFIDVSLLVGSLSRSAAERDQFLFGWVLTYCISYVGYIFLPAQGPGGFLATAYSVELHGGCFYRMVVAGMVASGGLRGVFPSLHVASSLYICLFDLRTHRLRGLTYLPLVVLIYGATIFLRYHYVIDLVLGTLIAVGCVRIAPRVFVRRSGSEQRELVEGAGYVLPGIPAARCDYAAAVLQAN